MHLARHASILFSLISIMTFMSATQTAPFKYPQPRRGDQVDDYHGTKVADPYRWLEDTDATETHAWVEAENKVTFASLEQIPNPQPIPPPPTNPPNSQRSQGRNISQTCGHKTKKPLD